MSRIDYKKLENRISNDPETFLRTLGYDGDVKSGEFVCGDVFGNPGKSFQVNLKNALFNDLNTSSGGSSGKGWINLIAAKLECDKSTAAQNVVKTMGWNEADYLVSKKENKPSSELPVMPVPDDADDIPFQTGFPLRAGSDFVVSDIHRYRDLSGRLMHGVLRTENKIVDRTKPKKEIRPLYYFGKEKGWLMKGQPRSLKTLLYGLEYLTMHPNAPVLITEGEKTTDAARKLYPDYICMTWQGGVGRLEKADWTPLNGRDVVYWPDADEAGRNTIPSLQTLLGLAGDKSLKVVKDYEVFPNKWDLADPCPEGVDLNSVLENAEVLDLSPVKQLLGLSYFELRDNWYYVVETQEFIHLPTGICLVKKAFEAMYEHLPDAKNKTVGTSFLRDFQENKLVKRSYCPGVLEEIVTQDGQIRALNTWRPSKVKPIKGDSQLFIAHLKYLTGSPEEFEQLANMLAFMVQFPGKKLKSAPIIVGRQGTGKSYVGEMMRELVGPHNCSVIETHELKSEYSDFMEDAVLVVLEELMAIGRKDILNSLKPKITQDVIPLRKKYANQRDIPNTVNFIAFTNNPDALPLDNDDRRYFVTGTDDPKKDDEYYGLLWDWSKNNYGVILDWLLSRDLSNFNPNARPPLTTAKSEMVEASRPFLEAEIERLIAEREPPFESDLVVLKDVVRHLNHYIREANHTTVSKALKANKAKNLGQKKVIYDKTEKKVSLWAIRNVTYLASLSSAAVARMYFEAASGSDPRFYVPEEEMFPRD